MVAVTEFRDESEAKKRTFDPPADGWCTLQLVETSADYEKSKKTPTNEYLWWDVEVVDHPNPESIGRKFRYMATLRSLDSKTRAGGLHDYNQLCKAAGFTGYSQVDDSKQLLFKPFRALIVSRVQKDSDRANTNIKTFGFEDPEEKAVAGASSRAGAGASSAGAGAGAAGAGAGAAGAGASRGAGAVGSGAASGGANAGGGAAGGAGAGGDPDWRQRARNGA